MVLGIEVDMYVAAEHVQELIESEGFTLLPPSISAALDTFLSDQFEEEWSQNRSLADWANGRGGRVFAWAAVDDRSLLTSLYNAGFGRRPWAVLLYNASEPCIAGSFDAMVLHLDELVWKAPGLRVLLAVSDLEKLVEVLADATIIWVANDGKLIAMNARLP